MDKSSVITSATTAGGAGGRRKIDDRVKVLLEDCNRKKHRSIFLLLGDRSKDQITSVHAMLSHANHTSRVNVVWCMKNEPLFISTAKSKLRRQGEREIKAGMASEESKDAFETFLSHNDIRFTHYKDTHRILGQTFGMAILQDFEAMTPNILARTIETVQGGGAILILLRSMSELKQLYTMAMDVHSRYRSDTHGTVIPRFNERFILSLCDCENMIALDDDLNVLAITENIKKMLQRKQHAATSQAERLRLEGRTKHEADLADLKTRLKDHPIVGPLVSAANTVDQAKTILGLMQSVAEKSLNTTCAVTAGRGRGKSAALGLTLAGAIKEGYSNILVTAPSPDNLGTLFEFAIKGLKELGYVERNDFNVMLSTNPEFAKCVVALQVFKEHRQTIQFVAATDSEHFRNAEILVVDEAAAIPLALVQRMIGPYLVFLSSTISGYEGTGRSLSLKLIADMKKRATTAASTSQTTNENSSSSASSALSRQFKDLQMSDPIRYGPDDPVEAWLNKLLCFDAVSETQIAPSAVPHPSKCDLYYVDRDALFSYNSTAEILLHKIMALLVAAHYKNQPNDLQLLSDAPGHHLFVLCAPNTSSSNDKNNNNNTNNNYGLPDILCVIHACEEGNVAADSLAANLDRGSRPAGDLIPYTIGQQYLDKTFPKLAGIRVVRIATNPEIQRSGYGSRALDLFCKYYEGKLHDISSSAAVVSKIESVSMMGAPSASAVSASSEQQQIAPRKTAPALLKHVVNRPPAEACEYVGVSFGLNIDLYNFWNRSGFDSIYLRQIPNELTGEHSCIMVKSLLPSVSVSEEDSATAATTTENVIFHHLKSEFRRRFLALLPISFKNLSVDLAVCLVSGANGKQNYLETVASRKRTVENNNNSSGEQQNQQRPDIFVQDAKQITWNELLSSHCFVEQDLQRLKLFASGVSEVAVMLDLTPTLASLYFRDKMHFRAPSGNDGVVLSPAQRAILLAVALQGKHFEDLPNDKTQSTFRGVPAAQLKGIFHKAIGKFVDYLNLLKAEAIAENQNNNNNEDEENEEEVKRDAKGNIIGLQVVRKIKKRIETDQTLLHDSGSATISSSAGAGSRAATTTNNNNNNNKESGMRRKRS